MAAVGLTLRDFGSSVMETMTRPWSQWHHNEPQPSRQGSRSDFQSNQNDPWVPRSERPPTSPLTFPPPRDPPSCLSRRNSLHSNHASTPTSLGMQSSSCSMTIADSPYSPEASQRPLYNYWCPPGQRSPVISGRSDISVPCVMRTQQLPVDYTPMTDRHDTSRTFQPRSLTSIHSSTPGPSQARVTTRSLSPRDRQTQNPWQEPRKAMPVSSLLNEESPVKPSATSPNETTGKSRSDPIRYELSLRQQPVNARSCGFGDRDRRVIDPPPILQLEIHAPHLSHDVVSQMLKSPLNIVHCSIWSADGTEEMSAMPEDYTRRKRLMGNLVASPFFGEDEHGNFASFFCFPDISCRTPGQYRLKFSLITIDPRPNAKAPVRCELLSKVFQTFTAKDFPGMSESTALAKALRSQGCNIPTKKGNEKSGRREESDDNSDDESPQRKRVRSNQ